MTSHTKRRLLQCLATFAVLAAAVFAALRVGNDNSQPVTPASGLTPVGHSAPVVTTRVFADPSDPTPNGDPSTNAPRPEDPEPYADPSQDSYKQLPSDVVRKPDGLDADTTDPSDAPPSSDFADPEDPAGLANSYPQNTDPEGPAYDDWFDDSGYGGNDLP